MEVKYTFRVDSELWEKFKAAAVMYNRSANAQLEIIVKEYVASIEGKLSGTSTKTNTKTK